MENQCFLILSSSWASLGPSSSLLGISWALLVPLGSSGALLGTSWGQLGLSHEPRALQKTKFSLGFGPVLPLALFGIILHILTAYSLILEPVWAHLGPSWAHLGTSWACLGPLLGPSWAYLGPSWAYLEALLAHLGPSWAHLRPTLTHLRPVWKGS